MRYARSLAAICAPSASCVTLSQNDATSTGSGLSTSGLVALTVNRQNRISFRISHKPVFNPQTQEI